MTLLFGQGFAHSRKTTNVYKTLFTFCAKLNDTKGLGILQLAEYYIPDMKYITEWIEVGLKFLKRKFIPFKAKLVPKFGSCVSFSDGSKF